ncbi:TPA: DUF1653 domain-containing protein, partial [Escherichia coli]
IKKRRSVKLFKRDYKISNSTIREMISAVMLSPTAFNIQNWRFVIIDDPKLRAKIRQHAWDQPQITDASVVIGLCADLKAWKKEPERYWRHVSEDIRELMVSTMYSYYEGNIQYQRDEAFRSCGIAAQSLMLVAKSMGYDSCPMDGFDFPEVEKLINLPKDHVLTMLIAIGKAAQEPGVRGRELSYDEVVFSNSFPSETLEDYDGFSFRKAVDEFVPGVYKHYKGKYYLAIGLAREDHTDKPVVVYSRLYERNGFPLSTRTLEDWNSIVSVGGVSTPRFVYVGQYNK